MLIRDHPYTTLKSDGGLDRQQREKRRRAVSDASGTLLTFDCSARRMSNVGAKRNGEDEEGAAAAAAFEQALVLTKELGIGRLSGQDANVVESVRS